jgi:gluconolactonase
MGDRRPRTCEARRVIFATDLALPEAPLLLPDGSWLVTELAFERGRVTHVSADGKDNRTIATTGRPNGLARGRDGTIWVCETLTPSIIRLQLSGEAEPVLTEVEGVPLLWPNDLCFGQDGALYITDSGILVSDFLDERGAPVANCQELPFNGRVIRFDPSTGDARILDEGYQFANGIACGPDGRLYANETMTGNVYRYTVDAAGTLGRRELFGNVLSADWTGSGLRGPDGMAFSPDGRLWIAVFGQGDVTVLGPDGTPTERLPLVGRAPTNVAFGKPGEQRIYVVEDEFGTIEAYDVDADGFPLYD